MTDIDECMSYLSKIKDLSTRIRHKSDGDPFSDSYYGYKDSKMFERWYDLNSNWLEFCSKQYKKHEDGTIIKKFILASMLTVGTLWKVSDNIRATEDNFHGSKFSSVESFDDLKHIMDLIDKAVMVGGQERMKYITMAMLLL